MDPNEALAQIRNARWRIERALEVGTNQADLEELAGDLAEKVNALDAWLMTGGFLPKAWAR